MSNPIPSRYPAAVTPRPGLLALVRQPAGTVIQPPSAGCGYQSRDLLELMERGHLVQHRCRRDGLWYFRVRVPFEVAA